MSLSYELRCIAGECVRVCGGERAGEGEREDEGGGRGGVVAVGGGQGESARVLHSLDRS